MFGILIAGIIICVLMKLVKTVITVIANAIWYTVCFGIGIAILVAIL